MVRGSVTKSRFTRKKFAISQFTGNKKGLSRVTKKPFTTLCKGDPRSYINATYAVAKRKSEKIRLAGIRTLTSAQLVRALHRYRRGQGSNPGKPDFFRLSFRNCVSCVNNCEDLLYIYLFVVLHWNGCRL